MTAAIPTSTIAPRIRLGDWVNDLVDWLTDNLTWLFDGLNKFITALVDGIADPLKAMPIIVVIVIMAVLGLLSRGVIFALGTVVGMLAIDALDLFPKMIDTLALSLVSGILALLLAIPLGILAARNHFVATVVRPVLDFMQTLPAYVYLVPFLFLVGIGPGSAIPATIIFAMPPGVRLTQLGIQQVDREMVEAGQAFGATPREVLRGIQLPLALPTIMAGVNQVIMLSLSMVVISAVVGAPGLGDQVLSALSTLEVGPGAEAGIAIVILAIYLDRLTDGFSKPELGAVARARAINEARSQQAATGALTTGGGGNA